MELKELKCKNCGANLKVDQNAKDVTCNFCHTTFSVETMENTGYEFEKGRIKAQKEEMNNNLDAAKDSLNKTISSINVNGEDVSKAAKGIGIVFAIVAVVIFATAAIFMVTIFSNIKKVDKAADNGFKSISDKAAASKFNSDFEVYKGSEPLTFVKEALETAVIANKAGKHEVEVVYNDIKTTDPDKIIELKNSLTKDTYGISYEYDDKGYINKLILMDV